MKAEIKNDKLIIELDLQKAKASVSGTTLVVASTKGRRCSGLSIDGNPVWIIANAFVYPINNPAVTDGKTPKKQKVKKIL